MIFALSTVTPDLGNAEQRSRHHPPRQLWPLVGRGNKGLFIGFQELGGAAGSIFEPRN